MSEDAYEARAAVFGGAMTNQEVQATVYCTTSGISQDTLAVVARYVDDDNYFRLQLRRRSTDFGAQVEFVKKIGGVETTLVSVTLGVSILALGRYQLSLIVFASGRAIGRVTGSFAADVSVEVIDAVLATGGALASGKGGIADQKRDTVAAARRYDDVVISTPAAEPIALYSGRRLEIRSDATQRESSAGGTYGQPASYRGSRFKVQPAGDRGRTTRIAAKASRNDLTSAEDANLTDQIALSAVITPRYSVTPRS
jgi:hypothetical protein